MRTKLNLNLCLLLIASFLAGCGSSDNGRVFGNGYTGNGYVDQQIISQIPCNSSVGPQARTTIGFRSINGVTQPLNNANIPTPSRNGFSSTAIGRTTYGDVVILTQTGTTSDLIISLCHRSYIQSNTVNQIQAAGFLVDSNSFCGYSALVSGTVQIGFGSNFGAPITETLYPRPLYESMPNMNCQF
ncbi:MAG: hypothetical protein JNM93_07015 [Bacteriovoracaceae bacterium]|nr:hypothetical protein [Bacteriovoracaceae bacterium]